MWTGIEHRTDTTELKGTKVLICGREYEFKTESEADKFYQTWK